MNKVYLILGSNLSDPWKQLFIARKKIAEVAEILMLSPIYTTAAWGKRDQPDFLNQVIIISTPLEPAKVLELLLKIETNMGRIRTEKNAPRLIDIDILFYNSEILITDELTIPHPHIAGRRFVLIPLNALSPDYIHPVLNESVAQLLQKCNDALEVKRY